MVIKVDKHKDFEGAAKIELLGLPNEVTTEPREITKDSTELVFPVKTTANSPAGRHKTVICRATIMANGEPIAHTLGTGELRIDEPLPPKAAARGRAEAAATAAAAPRRCRKNASANWKNCGWNASKPKPPDSPEEQNDSRHRTARMLVHGIGLGRHRSGRRCARP